MRTISQSKANAIEEFTASNLDRLCEYAHELQQEIADSLADSIIKVEVILRLQQQIKAMQQEIGRCSRAIRPLD